MGKRIKTCKGLEVISRKEEGMYYLDKPGEYEADDVHLVLFKKDKGRKRSVIYLLDLELITTSSSKSYFEAVSDTEFQNTLKKVSGINSNIYITNDAKLIIEIYGYLTNPNRI